MLSKNITINNKLGLHARAAMKLVTVAGKFQSKILIHFKNREINAKSIMNLMVIGATKGSKLNVTTEGLDEDKAMRAVTDLINDKFGEIVGAYIYSNVPIIDADLINFLSDKLANYKLPEIIKLTSKPLPRIASEKIDRVSIKKLLS